MQKSEIHKNILFIVVGPSGSGKGTFMDYASENFPSIKHIPTYTTRAPRPKETPGKDYNYISNEEFQNLIDQGNIFEYTRTYGDYYYGSPQTLINNEEDTHLIVELDYKGMFRVKSVSNHRVVSVFILPPDIETLLSRINKRYKEKNLAARIKVIQEQMQFAWAFDYVIVNNDLKKYLKDSHTIIEAELVRNEGIKALLDSKHSADPTLNQ